MLHNSFDVDIENDRVISLALRVIFELNKSLRSTNHGSHICTSKIHVDREFFDLIKNSL